MSGNFLMMKKKFNFPLVKVLWHTKHR